ncbi:septation protein SepH [Corynebacterium kroppenstedtii]|uniref:septation protein SepH n=1 Tax=Corynebacterium sp. PCR 32 TaxID=3351342 RepID=UPI0030AFDDF9
MQTLSLIPEECTDDYLVFTVAHSQNDDHQLAELSETTPRFTLPLTSDLPRTLQRLLPDIPDGDYPAINDDTPTQSEKTPPFLNTVIEAEVVDADITERDHDKNSATTESTGTENNGADRGDVPPAEPPAHNTPPPDDDNSPGLDTDEPALTLTPREIQTRIRGGESIHDLARDSGMPEYKIEPFAHPILAERERMTAIARQSHPVRQDGPSTLTLDDVVATAFTARSMNLTDASWNAYRDDSRLWIITLTWTSELSEITAEWSYHTDGRSTTTVARNEAATDLVDPDFGRPSPGRDRPHTGSNNEPSASPYGPSPQKESASPLHGLHTEGDPDFAYNDTTNAPHAPTTPSNNNDRTSTSIPARASLASESHPPHTSPRTARGRRTRRRKARMEIIGLDEHRTRRGDPTSAGNSTPGTDTSEHSETASAVDDATISGNPDRHDSVAQGGPVCPSAADSGVQNPDNGSRPRRRRKAVTPHWEDVLLGVRTNRSEPPRNRGHHSRDHD